MCSFLTCVLLSLQPIVPCVFLLICCGGALKFTPPPQNLYKASELHLLYSILRRSGLFLILAKDYSIYYMIICSWYIYRYPMPMPPVQPNVDRSGGRLPISQISAEAPACVQNAMMTKDKKPFTYTPGGIDLSQIKSPRMAKRLALNASSEGVKPKQSPLAHQASVCIYSTICASRSCIKSICLHCFICTHTKHTGQT